MAGRTRREFLKRSVIAAGAVAGVVGGWRALGGAEGKPARPAGGRPNIVVILADDLGIECLSSYGGTAHETPNLDKLAGQGMRFTHVFSNPLCSPSRASLLTGRYPFKNGMKVVIYDEKRHANTYLKTDQPSFARQLKQAGYATAIAGKWQLSFLHQRNTIGDFGFDEYQCWQIFTGAKSKTRRFHKPHFNKNGKIIADQIKHRYGPDVNVEFPIDFSDLFPTLCELAGAAVGQDELHGRSFVPQLLGKPRKARKWVHVQNAGDRHVRNRKYILNNRNQFRPVVRIWEPPAKPNQSNYPETARKTLQAIFDNLDK